MDLEDWSVRLKVFADATRVRLLALLELEELTVAELSAITRLAQPRVSTHLAKLKEAGLVRDRRAGVSAYYRFDEAALDPAQRTLWHALSTGSDDPLLRQDAEIKDTFVIMVTAMTEEQDRIAGFEVGADDYVTKPFSVKELVLRVQVAARRSQAQVLPAVGPAEIELVD